MRIVTLLALCVAVSSAEAAGSITAVSSFGSNPGGLAMYEYVPASLGSNRPLVVVLHGCTQSASAMTTAGWNTLADQYKFAVVYAQQQSANNPVECFNWAGEYGDTANLVRGQGENESIIQMVDTAIAAHGLDTTHVFVVGFSAGAAFTSVMLATWPDRFAAGSIMEGVAYRCATSVSGAYSCQSPGVTKTAAQWGDLVRAASTVTTFPRVQIWEGTKDTTVVPANEAELVKQWTNVHGIDQTVSSTETIGAAKHEVYKSGTTVVVETYTVTDMTHAIASSASDTTCPTGAAQYFEDHGICATVKAAQFFGLVPVLGGGGGSGSGGGLDAPPTVAFQSPTSGDTVSGAITIVVAASDDRAVTAVDLAIDGVAIGSDTDAPYQFAWDAATPGDHQLVATAHDDGGQTSTATATITVPGAGGGSNPAGSGSDTPPHGPGPLPGCSLDVGGGGAGLAPLAGVLALVLRSGRRRRSRRAQP